MKYLTNDWLIVWFMILMTIKCFTDYMMMRNLSIKVNTCLESQYILLSSLSIIEKKEGEEDGLVE